MDLRILYAILLSVLPISELRGGLPLAIVYATENNVPVVLVFSLILLLNILVIFFVFFFLDKMHHIFMKLKIYRKLFNLFVGKFQRKVDKFEKKYSNLGFFALVLFVAVPLPGTGAWTGCLVSWILGLDRKKSIAAIAFGITIAGILILFGTLGFLSLLS